MDSSKTHNRSIHTTDTHIYTDLRMPSSTMPSSTMVRANFFTLQSTRYGYLNKAVAHMSHGTHPPPTPNSLPPTPTPNPLANEDPPSHKSEYI